MENQEKYITDSERQQLDDSSLAPSAVSASALEARRLDGKMRKRRHDARERVRKNEEAKKHKLEFGSTKADKDEAAKDAEWLAAHTKAFEVARPVREREALLNSELTPPIDSADSDGDGYWLWVLRNLEDFLVPLENKQFAELYSFLNGTKLGRLILGYFGVALFPVLPDGWVYLYGPEVTKFKTPYGPSLPLHSDMSDDEMNAYAQTRGVERWQQLPVSAAQEAFRVKFAAPVNPVDYKQKLERATQITEEKQAAQRRAWQGRLYSLAAVYKKARLAMKAQIAEATNVGR